MREVRAVELRLELFRLQCSWRRTQHLAEVTGEPLPPFPRDRIEHLAAQLPRSRVGASENAPGGSFAASFAASFADVGEPREYVDAMFRAEPTGTAGAIDLGGRACSAWVHCHRIEPQLSAMRCELVTTVPLVASDVAAEVGLRSCVRSQFAWVEAASTESGLAALRAEAWLEVALVAEGTEEDVGTEGDESTEAAASASLYDHVFTGRQLFFPNQKSWRSELVTAIVVPPGREHTLLVREAIELFACAEGDSNAYMCGRFAWEPLRLGGLGERRAP
jgi:hypothetical protein